MLLLVNALLYVVALTLAVAVISPMPEHASRRARWARRVLALGGSLTIAAAIALALLGLWLESALAGCAAIVIVGVCLCIGLACEAAPAEDEEEDDDDGGSLFGPVAPEPTKPDAGPSDDLWTEFDLLRAEWAREREPSPA